MPLMRTCAECGRIIPVGTSRCALHARPPRRRTRQQRKERALVLAGAVICGICGGPLNVDPDDPTVCDHVIPLARGGADHITNLQPAHRSCNQRKAASPPVAWL